MHEMSVAIELHRACRAEMEARGGGRLESVAVAVGELSAVEPDLLRFAWDAITSGEADAGAALEIEWRAARQRCEACGPLEERQPGTWLRLCPHCEAPLLVEGGRDLDILTIGYEPATSTEEAST